jgi:hypothetical protein
MALHQPVDLPDQLIHGDITENVLFAPDLPPAIIDLSPFWRPAAYAQAIIVADALDWCGADQSTLPWVDNIPQRWQLIIRAEIFRISIHDGFFGGELGNHDTIDGHLATVALLECKLGHDAIRLGHGAPCEPYLSCSGCQAILARPADPRSLEQPGCILSAQRQSVTSGRARNDERDAVNVHHLRQTKERTWLTVWNVTYFC